MHNMRTAPGPDHESASKMETELAEKPATGPEMRVESVNIRKTANGAYVVQCNKVPVTPAKNGMSAYVPPEDYAFSTFGEAMDYAAKEFGEAAAAPAAPVVAEVPPPVTDDDEALA